MCYILCQVRNASGQSQKHIIEGQWELFFCMTLREKVCGDHGQSPCCLPEKEEQWQERGHHHEEMKPPVPCGTGTFEGAKSWLTELRQNADPKAIIMLVGNKRDLQQQREVSVAEGEVITLSLCLLMRACKHDFYRATLLTYCGQHVCQV